MQHMESCGKQITSRKVSNPSWSWAKDKRRFFNDAADTDICLEFSQLAAESSQRAVERNQRAAQRSSVIRRVAESVKQHPTSVIRGFGSARRFLEDPKTFVNHRADEAIVHSTHASPFSATCPYNEPSSIQPKQL